LHQGECVAGNPKIYGQLVATLAKYSKFAGAGDKAAVRQAALDAAAAASQNEDDDAPVEPVAPKATLTSRRIKAVSPVPAVTPKLPDAPF
jgi:myo-inositol-1(or 4)-monophosphatase